MIKDWNLKFAENIRHYEGYSIGKLFKLLRDPDLISLAGGLPSPDIFLKDEMRFASQQRLDHEIEKIMQYSDITGETKLIEAVIEFLKEDEITISEKNILITTSGQQGLDLAGRLFLNPGDSLILDRPTFAGAIVAFQLQRPVFEGVNITQDGSDIEGIRRKIRYLKEHADMPKFIYVVPDFQNPSGITMSLQKRLALLELSYEYGIPIIEDSPYRDLRYYGESIPSLYSLDQKGNGANVIGLYTFSKLFCPGMRVGFNIGPKDVIAKMTNIKEGSTLNTPKYNQDICTAFLKEMDRQAHLQKCRTYYREKLEVFLSTLKHYFPQKTGVTWTKPHGGLFLWITVPQTIDTAELFYKAVKHKVAFVPGEVFYGENPEKNHMRVNFSYPSKDQLIEAVKRLSDCIQNRLHL
jgi:2-aminoadipate transaminase